MFLHHLDLSLLKFMFYETGSLSFGVTGNHAALVEHYGEATKDNFVATEWKRYQGCEVTTMGEVRGGDNAECTYLTPKKAALAYDRAVFELRGSRALLNFIALASSSDISKSVKVKRQQPIPKPRSLPSSSLEHWQLYLKEDEHGHLSQFRSNMK
nr:ethylene-responsive transcription factor 1A-like [Ipomoea trifida]